jgi:hypothetical protein
MIFSLFSLFSPLPHTSSCPLTLLAGEVVHCVHEAWMVVERVVAD